MTEEDFNWIKNFDFEYTALLRDRKYIFSLVEKDGKKFGIFEDWSRKDIENIPITKMSIWFNIFQIRYFLNKTWFDIEDLLELKILTIQCSCFYPGPWRNIKEYKDGHFWLGCWNEGWVRHTNTDLARFRAIIDYPKLIIHQRTCRFE